MTAPASTTWTYRGVEVDRVAHSGMWRAFHVPGAPTAWCFADTKEGMRELIRYYATR